MSTATYKQVVVVLLVLWALIAQVRLSYLGRRYEALSSDVANVALDQCVIEAHLDLSPEYANESEGE